MREGVVISFWRATIEIPDIVGLSLATIIGILLACLGRRSRELGPLFSIGLMVVVVVIGLVATGIAPINIA